MIVIFARVPEPGKTKTRLIPALGPVEAARLSAAMTHDVIEMTRKTSLPFRVSLAGDTDHPWTRTLGCDWEPQIEGDLGRKLAHALRDGGVAIGTDAPTLPSAFLHEATASSADVVLAPAFDGGFTLVGVTDPDDIFELVPWSSPETYSRQHQRAIDLGRSVRVLPFWYDIDEPADLDFLSRHLSTLSDRIAPRTREWFTARAARAVIAKP